jgi:hypothetical protein
MIMRNIFLQAFLFAIILPLSAQQIKTLDDIAFHVRSIDSNKAVKRYSTTIKLPDTANKRRPVQYEYIADSLTGNLIKAIIKDDRFNLARTYYFVNDRLIKLYEKVMDQSKWPISRTHFFRDDNYSIARIAQSEMYDDKGTLHIDHAQILAKTVTNNSFVQNEPRRKGYLEDAYILLLNFRKIKDSQ